MCKLCKFRNILFNLRIWHLADTHVTLFRLLFHSAVPKPFKCGQVISQKSLYSFHNTPETCQCSWFVFFFCSSFAFFGVFHQNVKVFWTHWLCVAARFLSFASLSRSRIWERFWNLHHTGLVETSLFQATSLDLWESGFFSIQQMKSKIFRTIQFLLIFLIGVHCPATTKIIPEQMPRSRDNQFHTSRLSVVLTF